MPQLVTIRLADSVPRATLERWVDELRTSRDKPALRQERLRASVERFLDSGAGSCTLCRQEIADVVRSSLERWDGERYILHAWTLMPNHLHVLFTPAAHEQLGRIMKSWKAYSGRRANAILGADGAFWAEDYYDRYIRDASHFERAVDYVLWNPVKAGLCPTPAEWRHGSGRLLAPYGAACSSDRSDDRSSART